MHKWMCDVLDKRKGYLVGMLMLIFAFFTSLMGAAGIAYQPFFVLTHHGQWPFAPIGRTGLFLGSFVVFFFGYWMSRMLIDERPWVFQKTLQE